MPEPVPNRRRPPRAVVGAFVAVPVVVALVLARGMPPFVDAPFGDLDVYRHAAARLVMGEPVYAGEGLPFVYPPFAAVLFVPFGLVRSLPAHLAFTVLSAGAGLLAMAVLLRRLGLPAAWMGAGAVAAFALEPLVRTLHLGQVNLVLLALVVVDVLVLPARWRGVLVGVATGIKLTPGVFALYYALRRDWASLARVVAGFGLTVVAGLLAAPSESLAYWTRYFHDPGRAGGYAHVDNQSLYAVAVRLLRTEHPPLVLTLGLSAGALAVAACAAYRLLRHGDRIAALTAVALGGLLASPVSWTHHWVWWAPALVLLWRWGAGRARVRVLWWLTLAAVYLAPMWWTPHGGLREFEHTWWQAGLCLTFPALALAWLVVSLRSGRGRDGVHAAC